MEILIGVVGFGSILLVLGLSIYGEKLYSQYPGRGVGRFASRVIQLALGSLPGPIFVLITAVANPYLSLFVVLIPLPLMIALGLRYRHQTNWRCRIELLSLYALIWSLTWAVIPQLGYGFFVDGLNEFYIDDYIRFLSIEQYAIAFLGALVALVILCLVLMRRAGRLARMYDTPAVQPDSDHPAVSLETKIS